MLLGILVGSFALFSAGCERLGSQPLRVGLLVRPPHEMGVLARELAYYDSSEIELVDFMSPARVTQAFRNHSIDAMAVTLDYALAAREKGVEPRIVMAIGRSRGLDALVAKPGIESLEGLKGRRVGLESSALGPFVLKSALRSRDIEVGDLELVPIDLSDHVEAFRQDRVDAVVTYPPSLSILKEAGGRVIYDSSEMSNGIVDVLVAHESVVERQRAALVSFVAAWMRAVRYYREHPSEAARCVIARERLTVDHYLEAMQGVELFGREDNLELLTGEDPPLRRRLQPHRAVMREMRTLQEDVPVDDLVDGSIAREAGGAIVAGDAD